MAGVEAFATMFSGGRYLRLMNLRSFVGAPSVEEAFDELERCASAAADPVASVEALFADPNWRLHVVAATAMVMGIDGPRVRAAAWTRLDDGSWASPQIVAALSLTDTDFVDRASERLETCGRDAKKLGALLAATKRAVPDEVPKSTELDIGLDVTPQWLERVAAILAERGRPRT